MHNVKLIPLSDAAVEMAVSWQTAWRMLLSRELPGVKKGARWFVQRDAVERVVRERETRTN